MIIISDTKARSCVGCGKEFNSNDDVVVCPECGAPHHRECWQAEGHCHYEVAHGTDLEWHPKEEPEEQKVHHEEAEPPPHRHEQSPIFVNGIAMVKCPECGKIVRCGREDMPCPRCGHTIKGQPNQFDPAMGGPGSFKAAPIDFGEPIDGVESGKVARVVLQRNDYYLPRFRMLKKQGSGICSWNWAACLLTPYWFAFRKCYLWSAFSAFFSLLSTILCLPVVNQAVSTMPENATSYSQLYSAFYQIGPSSPAMLLAYGGLLILVIRGVIFGLLGNYIYKKECLKRIEVLDTLPPQEANHRIFKLGGCSILAPLIAYYATSIAENILMMLI